MSSQPDSQTPKGDGDGPSRDQEGDRDIEVRSGHGKESPGSEEKEENEEKSQDEETKDDEHVGEEGGGTNTNGKTPAKDKIKKQTKKPSGGIDHTPLPDAPPGFTLKFTFHKATNLPPADIATASADPYLTARLQTSAPKRHKQDPDLTYRTPTLRKTTDPEWNAEWIVANIPSSGCTVKCRLFDEDYPDHDDRLGNVTIKIHHVSEDWEGFPSPGREFQVKKRVGSKRAYALKALASMIAPGVHMTPSLWVSVEVLGKSDPPHAMVHTIGPSVWIKHFSPMIGRIAGTKVHKDEAHDSQQKNADEGEEKKTKKYEYVDNPTPCLTPCLTPSQNSSTSSQYAYLTAAQFPSQRNATLWPRPLYPLPPLRGLQTHHARNIRLIRSPR